MRFTKMRALTALVATGVLVTASGRLSLHAQTQAAAPSGRLAIHIGSNAIGFGSVRLGQASPPRTITFENVGNAPMSIDAATLGGANPSDFSLLSTCGGLSVGGVCTMTFTFTPGAQGPRAAMLLVTASTPTAPYMVPLVGLGIDANTPQPSVGPIDARTGFPMYFSDGYNAVELCLDHTPPNGADGQPQPQSIDSATGLLTPTMCLAPVPDPTKPPAVTDSPATTNFDGEAFWWSAEATATPAGWKRAILVLAQEAAFSGEAAVAGQQWAFGRVRLRADGVPAGRYRFTHPFGVDEAEVSGGDDDRIFDTSDMGCFNTPCDFTLALNTRVTRFLQCVNAPIVVNGVEYLGDPNQECQVTGSPLNQNFFRVERVEADGRTTLLAETNLFAVSGKRFAPSSAQPPPQTNRPPVAVDDAATTAFETPVTVAVLANDSDPDLNDPLRVTSASSGAGATAINADGTITFTPAAGFSGVATVQYGIADAAGLGDIGIVTVTVGSAPPVNRPPVAAADTASTTAGVAITLTNLRANDSDPDGDALTITAVAQGSGGTAALGANSAVTFTPAAGFTGSASFTYTVSDGRGGAATGSVTVTVSPAAPQPTGLVLALNFDEGAGTQVLDHSGLATPNNGSMNAGVTWVAGRSAAAGFAAQFNGTSGMVTIPDAASLDLTTAVTMSAWVRPDAAGDWRSLIVKERGTIAAPGLSYSLYANDPTRTRPAGFFSVGGVDRSVAGTAALPLNAWTHVAVTYGGGFMRFFVNGVQVSQVAQNGNLPASNNPLRIGGNTLWGEFFAGQIDDLRIYNRVLAAAEIQADMNVPIQ